MPAKPEVQVGGESAAKVDAFSSPQMRFNANGKFVAEHRSLVFDDRFGRGADAALAQYVTELAAEVGDLNSAASVGFRLRGAVSFLQKFKTFAEPQEEIKRRPVSDSLKPTEPYRRP